MQAAMVAAALVLVSLDVTLGAEVRLSGRTSCPRVAVSVKGGATTNSKDDWVCANGVCELSPKAKERRRKAARNEDAGVDEDGDLADVGDRPLAFHQPKSLFKRIRLALFASASDGMITMASKVSALVKKMFGFSAKDTGVVRMKSSRTKPQSKQKDAPSPSPTSASSASTSASTSTKQASKAKKKRPQRRRGGPPRDSSATRIQRELRDMTQNAPENIEVSVRADNMNVWVLTLHGVEGTLFEGEKHKLRVEFPKDYPAKPPSVYFLKPTPRHPHVYTNGDICLDLLGKGWRPQINVRTLSLSILSMLSSAKEKGIPPDNSQRELLL